MKSTTVHVLRESNISISLALLIRAVYRIKSIGKFLYHKVNTGISIRKTDKQYF